MRQRVHLTSLHCPKAQLVILWPECIEDTRRTERVKRLAISWHDGTCGTSPAARIDSALLTRQTECHEAPRLVRGCLRGAALCAADDSDVPPLGRGVPATSPRPYWGLDSFLRHAGTGRREFLSHLAVHGRVADSTQTNPWPRSYFCTSSSVSLAGYLKRLDWTGRQ